MCRNKLKSSFIRVISGLIIICTMCINLTACSVKSPSAKKTELLLYTDGIINKTSEKIDKKDDVTGEITKVRYGDFEYEMFALGKIQYTDVSYETVETQYASFVSYNVEVGDKVNKGDVILTYSPQYDEAELQSKINDLHKREQEYTAGYDLRKAEIIKSEHDLSNLSGKEERQIKKLEINKLKLGLKQYVETKESIEKARNELDEYQSGISSSEIIAKHSGYILSLSDFAEGDNLFKGQSVAEISPKKEFLIKVDDNSGGSLRYNDDVTIMVAADSGKEDVKIHGKIISADNILSIDNSNNSTYVQAFDVPDEVNWNNAIQVYYKSKEINDVLMVKSGAVLFESRDGGTNVEDVPYVYVSKNGETSKRYIEVFGSNNEDYLILQGLSEGEQVVVQKQKGGSSTK